MLGNNYGELQVTTCMCLKYMGLCMCGVDLMVGGGITEKPSTYWVLEVNAAPGLDHYVKTGKSQEKIVEDMYLKVLKALE